MQADKGYEHVSEPCMWERAARELTLNSPEQLENFIEICTKILTKIAENPLEEKYQSLKIANALIANRVIPIKGGMSFLNASGFKLEVVGLDKVLVYKSDPLEALDSLAWLRLAFIDIARPSLTYLEHIRATCDTCTLNARLTAGETAARCCECIIQVISPQLTTSHTVRNSALLRLSSLLTNNQCKEVSSELTRLNLFYLSPSVFSFLRSMCHRIQYFINDLYEGVQK
jgi:hypothetical protein